MEPHIDIYYVPDTFGSLLSLVREAGIIFSILQVRKMLREVEEAAQFFVSKAVSGIKPRFF